MFDSYIGMEVRLSKGDDCSVEYVTIKRRKLDDDDDIISTASHNPLVDTIVYEVEYLDGTVEAISVNILAKNLLS